MNYFEKWQNEFKNQVAINIYVDLANVFGWKNRLGWKFKLKDFLEQLNKIESVKEVKVYFGSDHRNPKKAKYLEKVVLKSGILYITKPVKYIQKTISESFFVREKTMAEFNNEVILMIQQVVDIVKTEQPIVEEAKCNFDVEVTMDMLDDIEKETAIILLSGDSDFAAPLERLKIKGKKIFVMGVRGLVAGELFKIADFYIDFGKWYQGERSYIKSENPAKAGPRDI
jgi:uncharacterized LabA/DUF88 family protein